MKLRKRVYETKEQKRRDFWIGFGGWFAANAVLAVFVLCANPAFAVRLLPLTDNLLRLADSLLPWIALLIYLVPVGVNLLALIYLGLVRAYIALGALAAFGVALLLGLCGAGACFVAFESVGS